MCRRSWRTKRATWLAGYYAHCSAIDKSVGDIMETLDERG